MKIKNLILATIFCTIFITSCSEEYPLQDVGETGGKPDVVGLKSIKEIDTCIDTNKEKSTGLTIESDSTTN